MIAEEEEAHRLFLEEEYYYCSDEYEITDEYTTQLAGEIKPTLSNLDSLLIHGPHGIELECRFLELAEPYWRIEDSLGSARLMCSSNSDFMNAIGYGS